MVIAVVAAIAAVAAAVFAGLQGVAAVGARKDAEQARDEARADAASARAQAERAIAESARQSIAAERIAESLTRRDEPWEVKRATYSTMDLQNVSGRSLLTAKVEFLDGEGEPTNDARGLWDTPLVRSWAPRDRERFHVDRGGGLADAAEVWIVVTWWEHDDENGQRPSVWRQQLR